MADMDKRRDVQLWHLRPMSTEDKRSVALWWADKVIEGRREYSQAAIDWYDKLCDHLTPEDHLEWARRGADTLWGRHG